ncbi:MAG: hypothetical protein KDI69_07785 [Xanthomonadales bacterium]|nr:hypothetical protein [Xanthomonadales bacterium]
MSASSFDTVRTQLGWKWLALWLVLLAFGAFPAYVAGAGIWRFGFSYLGFGCVLLSLFLTLELGRLRPLAFDLMAALLAVASLLSMALFYRPFDAGASDWFGVELRIVLALMWIAICLVLAHLSTLLAKRIRSITQVEPQ